MLLVPVFNVLKFPKLGIFEEDVGRLKNRYQDPSDPFAEPSFQDIKLEKAADWP